MQGSLPAPEESLNGQFHTGFCFRGLNKSVLSPTSYELIKKLVGFVAAVSVERVRNRLALLTTGEKEPGFCLASLDLVFAKNPFWRRMLPLGSPRGVERCLHPQPGPGGHPDSKDTVVRWVTACSQIQRLGRTLEMQ